MEKTNFLECSCSNRQAVKERSVKSESTVLLNIFLLIKEKEKWNAWPNLKNYYCTLLKNMDKTKTIH